MEKKLRIKNLEFRKATYLGEEPEHPSYHIDKWENNHHYKQQDKYVKEGNYYVDPNSEIPYYIHKNCFKHKETCYAIASFDYDTHEGMYYLNFVADRPLDLKDEERVTFWRLIEHGYNILNPDEV